ncbi:MAG: FAD-binding domain-containing protein [Spirulinaceae cyanobacterium]
MQLLWFRRDLRLSDNPMVAAAAAIGEPVLPFFIIDPWFYDHPEVGSLRIRFLFDSLRDLDRQLRHRGNQLWLFEGNSLAILRQLAAICNAADLRPHLRWLADVQFDYGRERDQTIWTEWHDRGWPCTVGLNNYLKRRSHTREEWFAGYYAHQRSPLHPTPQHLPPATLPEPLPQLTLEDLYTHYSDSGLPTSPWFTGGATAGQQQLADFLRDRFWGYHWRMSQPAQAQAGGTTFLSPHIMFGTVSTRQVYQQIKTRAAELAHSEPAQRALKGVRDRLRWRDSAQQRLRDCPKIATDCLYDEFTDYYNAKPLTNQQADWYNAWCEGRTGFPLVDASLRQLKRWGWMNFRMRAMCATFLTINCGISWQYGAQHYMHCLIDGDVAIDHWQWQAQAGITNPLAGTFRIYSPNKNLATKDPDLVFVQRWVPELRGYDLATILAGRVPGYPEPILDWHQTRRIHGQQVTALRRAVQTRLEQEQGDEYHWAMVAKTVAGKWQQRRRAASR